MNIVERAGASVGDEGCTSEEADKKPGILDSLEESAPRRVDKCKGL